MAFLEKTARRAALALGLSWAFGAAGALAGCLGAGDDTLSVTPPADGGGEAHAGDGAAADAASEGHAGDAAPEGASDASADAGDATVHEAGDGGAAMPPSISFSSTAIDFGAVGCGMPAASKTLNITNNGGAQLAVSASLVGTAFTVSPTSLMIAPGKSSAFTLTATVPGSASPGTTVSGSLVLFTNDPVNANRILPLQATPSGAQLSGNGIYSFASSEVGVPAQPVSFQIKNTGNAPTSLVVGRPNSPTISIAPSQPDGGVTLDAGDSWNATASFVPVDSKPVAAQATVSAAGVTCGTGLSSILFTGQGATGSVTGWPASGVVDFGPVPCGSVGPDGGAASPPPQKVTLVNNNPTTDAHVTLVTTSGMNGFSTDVTVGAKIPSGQGTLPILFTAPPVPATSSLARVTGTLVFQTDADPSPLTILLSEEPEGAVLAFGDPSNGCAQFASTTNFGQFPSVILLQSDPPQNFCVTNAGNVPANVTLKATENTGGDAGVDASTDAAVDATLDATGVAGAPGSPFSISTPTFTVAPAPGSGSPSVQQESVTFQPVHANITVGTLAMSVDPSTTLCAPLPAPLPLSGSASGGGPVVTPTSLSFAATCGGPAPATQQFVVANNGSVDLTWTMSAITGPGAAQYSVMTSAPPGVLVPGANTTVVVTAAAVPSPAPDPSPAALTAQITINTDVPYDPPHVVTLTEVPRGDQLSVSLGNLRFGQVPVTTSISQSFTVTNNANAGSPDAVFALAVVSGLDSGATAYTVQSGGNVAAGATVTEGVTFDATTPGAYPATLTFMTTDALCTALPSPIVLSGTGTGGALTLSAKQLTFGTDPTDPNGYVNCGATGPPNTLTLSNSGNQGFNITSVTLGNGSSSPFTLSGPGMTLPAQLAINGSTTITITPAAIPATVQDPATASATYSDVLTITTNVTGDQPHTVPLIMQPYGVVIANTPVQTNWTFGTIGAGSIGTFTTTIRNTGNAPATVTLSGLSLPNVFGMENNPTTVPPSGVAELVGQFTPPSQDGTWTDQGQLVVAAASAFCEPLPMQWVTPAVNLTGSSNSNPIVTVSGSPVFATTDCGSAPPGGQPVTLTNSTNQAYAYTVKLGSGAFYTYNDANAGTLAANGTATIVVNPKPVSPGQGVLSGSAPYADDLLINVASASDAGASASDAGASVMSFTVPISWTLNGAVLSLPQGAGPNTANGKAFYLADSTSGFTLPMVNTGTASASVGFAIQPTGAFLVQPTPPIQVTPNVQALPELVATTASAACPSFTSGTATFSYTGPVCQPFQLTSVNVNSCAGTHP